MFSAFMQNNMQPNLQPKLPKWKIMDLNSKKDLCTSIHHWQLRHLLKPALDLVPQEERELSVLFVQDRTIYLSTIKDGAPPPKAIVSVDFSPYCFTYRNGFLAAAGNAGALSVFRHLETYETISEQSDLIWTGRAGRSAVNAVEICERRGSIFLLVSTNDGEVKSYNIPSMQLHFQGTFSASINHAMLNLAGDMLVAVGDCKEVFVHSLQDSKLEEYAVFSEADDFSYSCSWHSDDRTFAVGSQDGLVNVWDLRTASSAFKSGQALARFNSHQTNAGYKPIRSVQFSHSSSVDLLVFAEQVSFVSVVDTRSYEDRQLIYVNTKRRRIGNTGETDVAGVSFSPSCHTMFVSTPESILKFNTDVTSRRSFGCYTFH